jgi:hypothetical protein
LGLHPLLVPQAVTQAKQNTTPSCQTRSATLPDRFGAENAAWASVLE